MLDPTDPGSARLRFRLRPVFNWALVVVIFFIIAVFFNSIEVEIISGIVLMLLFAYALDKRSIGFYCPGCKNFILSNTPWVCRACGQINQKTDRHSFLSSCQNPNCGVEPKAYRCHHKECGEMIYLSADRDGANFASCLNASYEKPKRDEKEDREQKMKLNQELIEDKQHEILAAELDEKLRRIKKVSEEPKIKPKFEQKKEAFDEHYESAMGLREYAQRKRAEAAERYKNDPDSLKRANEAIDDFLRRSL